MTGRPENWNGVVVQTVIYYGYEEDPDCRLVIVRVTAWWPLQHPTEGQEAALQGRLRGSRLPASGPYAPGKLAAIIGGDLEGCVGIDVAQMDGSAVGRWRR